MLIFYVLKVIFSIIITNHKTLKYQIAYCNQKKFILDTSFGYYMYRLGYWCTLARQNESNGS